MRIAARHPLSILLSENVLAAGVATDYAEPALDHIDHNHRGRYCRTHGLRCGALLGFGMVHTVILYR